MGFLSSDPFTDARFGAFTRKGARWIGALPLPPHGQVELRVAGDRKAPSTAGIETATRIARQYASLKDRVAAELFEHYEPLRDAWDSGDTEGMPDDFPACSGPADVWAHVRSAVVDVDVSRHEFPVEIRLEVAWDDDHTLGVRMKDGALVELCGSTGP